MKLQKITGMLTTIKILTNVINRLGQCMYIQIEVSHVAGYATVNGEHNDILKHDEKQTMSKDNNE